MQMIKHPNIVELLEVLSSYHKVHLIMELIEGGDLFDHLEKKDYLEENEARLIFQQIICGLEYCHMQEVCHRDLKPENILISKDGVVKISDFGMSDFTKTDGQLMEGPNFNHTTCGTMNYLAPEVIKKQGYDGQISDVWACGVMLFFMLTGRKPFDNDEGKTQVTLQKI